MWIRWVCWAVIWAGLTSPAGGQEAAPDLVRQAVRAMGGEAALTRAVASHRRIKGAFPQDGFEFTGEIHSQPKPRRVKISQTGTDPNTPTHRVLVLEEARGWASYDGAVRDLDGEFLKRMGRARHADKVAGLVTLLQDKGYTLTPLPAEPVKGKPARGVKVAYAGQPDMHLYFDEKTHQLVKTWQRFPDEDSGQVVVHELYYTGYETLDPAGVAGKVLAAAGLPTDGPAVAGWLRGRVPAPDEAARVRRLVAQLGADQFRARTVATAEVQKLGPEAAPLLRDKLKDPDADPETVRRAEQCLEKLVAGPDRGRVLAAVRLLAARRPAGAAEALLAYLPWCCDDALRREVKAALYEVGTAGGRPDPHLQRIAAAANDPRQADAKAALGLDGGRYAKEPGRRLAIQDLTLPTRCAMYRDGKLHMVLETLEAEFFNAWDDAVFARPDPKGD